MSSVKVLRAMTISGIVGHCAMALGLYLLLAELPASAQVAIPFNRSLYHESSENSVSHVVAIGDEIWLGSDDGVFLVDRKSNDAVPMKGDTGSVEAIVSVGDELWVGATNGAFRIDRKSNEAIPMQGVTGAVTDIVPAGDEIWLRADKGLFRVDRKSNQAVPIRGDTGSVATIVPVGDELWVGATNGAFRIDRKSNQAVRVAGVTSTVDYIGPSGDEIWVGATNGAFRIDRKSNQAVRVAGVTSTVDYIDPSGDEIWLESQDGLFRVDRKSNQAVPIRGDTGSVATIVPVGDELWIGATNGAFRIDRKSNEAMRAKGVTGTVAAIVPVDDEIWLGAAKGLFRVDRKSNEAVLVAGVTGDGDEVEQIVPVGDEIWLRTTEGRVFRVDRKSNQAVTVERVRGTVVKDIVPVDDEIWLATDNGALLVDRRTEIQINLYGALPLVARFLRTPVWFEGNSRPIIRYVDIKTGIQSYDSSQAEPIKVVYDADPTELLGKETGQDNWTKVTQTGPIIQLKPGWAKIYFIVQDAWGNKTEAKLVQGWVLPTWTLSFLLPILGIGCCLVCLVLAPYIRYCHMLLMNPFLRNWISFGTVPLLLTTVPPLRRHIFRRYCRGLSCAPRFQSLAIRYVIPEERFSSSNFAEVLTSHRVVGLHGQSGIGKSAFLIYLAHQCASREAANPLLRRLVPVFVDLSIAGELRPEVMVRSELRKYGDLTDEKLTDVLLDHGGFLFLFDGLNEVSVPSGQAVVQFVDTYRNHSYACLATQVATEELKRVSTLVAASLLSDKKVKESIRKLAVAPETQREKFNPESLLNNFTDETYRICRIMFQLELVVEMWETSGAVPENLDGLFSYLLGPVVDKETWSKSGHGEYPDILSELAFKMMIGKRPYDPKKDYLPDELKTELVTRKLLVERGDVLEFRHDRVRGYLAAKHFSQKWRTILADNTTTVDTNWDAMLEFHLSGEQNANQARDLLFLLVKKDFDAAVRLNSWGQQNWPELFKDWHEEFSREIGKRVLGG